MSCFFESKHLICRCFFHVLTNIPSTHWSIQETSLPPSTSVKSILYLRFISLYWILKIPLHISNLYGKLTERFGLSDFLILYSYWLFSVFLTYKDSSNQLRTERESVRVRQKWTRKEGNGTSRREKAIFFPTFPLHSKMLI